MLDRNLATKDVFMAALGSGDMAALADCFHPNCVTRQSPAHPYGGEYDGPDGFITMLMQMPEAYSFETMENTHTFVSEDPNHIAFEFSLTGKANASGKPFASTVIEHWVFEDGKIIDIKPHWFLIPG